MALSTDRQNFSGLLPEAMVKRVLVSEGHSSLSLNIKMLIRDTPTRSGNQKMTNLVRNSSVVYYMVYTPHSGVDAEFLYPEYPARRTSHRQTLTQRLRERYPRGSWLQNGVLWGSFDVGDFANGASSQSDAFLASGTEVYDFYKEVTVVVPTFVSGLKMMIFSHLESKSLIDAYGAFSGLNMDFAESYTDNVGAIGTNGRVTTVLRDSKVPDYNHVYLDSKGKVWHGPKHHVTEGGVNLYCRKGAGFGDDTVYDDPILTARSVRNTKVIDLRPALGMAPEQPGVLQQRQAEMHSEFASMLSSESRDRADRASRGLSLKPARTRIENMLYEAHRTVYNWDNPDNVGGLGGELFLSVNPNNDLTLMFNINWMDILKRNSPYFNLFPSLSSAEAEQVVSLSTVYRICLKRRRIEEEDTGVSRFLSRAPTPVRGESPDVVATSYPMSTLGISGIDVVDVEYPDIADSPDHYLTFVTTDSTIKRRKGRFQYYVEYEFQDGLQEFFDSLLLRVENSAKLLQEFIKEAEIPVTFYEHPSTGQQIIRPDSGGNYNPQTGEFTERFKQRAGVTVSPIVDNFYKMSKFLNNREGDLPPDVVDHTIFTMRSMVHPTFATLETMRHFNNAFLRYVAEFRSLVSAGKKRNKSSLRSTTPRGDRLGMIKYVDYFDKTFSTDLLTSPQLFYFTPNNEGTPISSAAVIDLYSQAEEEASIFGIPGESFDNGIFLTPTAVSYGVPKGLKDPLSKEVSNKIGSGRQTIGPQTPRRRTNNQTVDVFEDYGEERIKINVTHIDDSEFDAEKENALNTVFSFAGASADSPTGQRERVLLPGSSPPGADSELDDSTSNADPAADERVSPVQNNAYLGNYSSFLNDIEAINSNHGATLAIDDISQSEGILGNIPSELLMDGSLFDFGEKYQLLRKLTQNHIDQLVATHKISTKEQGVIDRQMDIGLGSFTSRAFGVLGFLNILSSFDPVGFAPTSAGDAMSRASSAAWSVPPQFSQGALGTSQTPGVLSNGGLSNYVHGMTSEIKEVGSPSRGRRDGATQSRINTDLGQNNENTNTNLNTVSRGAMKRSSNKSGSKKYRICQVVPYENRDAGIQQSRQANESVTVNEFFLREVD